jgi:SAM-dependent methyltransferase
MTLDDFVVKARDFQESRVLLTALELDVFTAMGDGATVEQVAAARQTSERGMDLLLHALASMGVTTKAKGVFRLLPELRPHLGSKDFRAGWMHTVNVWNVWSTLTEAVRSGTSAVAPGVERRDLEWLESFIAAMHRNAAMRARRMVEVVGAAGVRRLLDVGGGSGAYAMEFARANEAVQAEVLDLPEVTAIAQRHIAAAGLAERVRTVVGDLRTADFGSGYDLILLSAICHMLGPDENRDLLRRCFAATAPGGRLVIREFVLDADRAGPKEAALFALNMLVGTRAGSSYSEQEYASWLRAAGYERVERSPADPDLIVASRGGRPV